MNYTHYRLSFIERDKNKSHIYCFFSIPEYMSSEDILDKWIPGDTTKRHIFTVRHKVLDEGVYKIFRNDALWKILEAWLKGLDAEGVYPVDTMKTPIGSVNSGQQIFGKFYLEL